MPRRGFTLWAASLGAIYVSASAIPVNALFARQSSCAAPNFNQCKTAGFPDYFCCPSGQFCIPLAANTTVLCCPDGADCQKIRPLPCEISLQDGEKNPDAVVKTTALGGTLERCGTMCCPFGYSCSNNECVRDQNQNTAPKQTTAKPNPTSTANPTTSATNGVAKTTTTAPDTANATENPSTTSGASAEASGSSGGPPVAAIAGGAAAGAVLLIGAAVVAFIFLRKKAASKVESPSKFSRSTSSFGNLISNPILQENTAGRTDFARGPVPRDSSEDPDSVTGALIADPMSPPDASGMLAVPPTAARKPERQSNVAYGYGGPELSGYVDMPYVDHDSELMPQTPRQYREPSSNSMNINIFAHPDITPDRTPESNVDRRYTDMTTFTQMLDNADLGDFARGESFVPYQPDGGHPPMPKK